MDLQKVCYGCFQEKEYGTVCPYCGFSEYQEQSFLALPLGAILNGRYLTGKVLGIGGFGITYLGYDLTLEIKVAIKEYMPSGMATRAQDGYTVKTTGRMEEEYKAGENKFLDEARILAKLYNEPNIVSVQNYFRENNTAYFVMEYVEGESLKELLAARGGRISYEEARSYLKPVMEALVHVHQMNLLHRDISPDNVYITKNGESRLLDFGAARFASNDHKSVSVILKHGFAPEEQYSTHGNQGPWTDVYAMAATFYHAITGQLPPDAIERMNYDRIVPPSQLGVAIPQMAETAIMKALSVKAGDRFANMSAFLMALEQSSTVGMSGGRQKTGGTNRGPVPAAAPGPVPMSASSRQPGISSQQSSSGTRAAASSTPASGGAPAADADAKRKKTILWGSVIVGALAAIAIIIIIAASGSKSSNSGDSYAGGGGGNSTITPAGPETTAAVITPTTQAPQEESTEAVPQTTAEAVVGLNTRMISVISAAIDLPDNYVASNSDLNYTDSANDRALYTDFTWNVGIPVYSHWDMMDYEDEYYAQYFGDLGVTDYVLEAGGEITLSGHVGYGRQVNTVENGQPYTYFFIYVDGANNFGSYVLIAKHRQGDSEGNQELLDALDSFQILGEVSVSGYTSYQNSEHDFKFIYTTNDVKGTSEFKEDYTYYMMMPGLTMNIDTAGDCVIEVIPANSTITSVDNALTQMDPYYTGYGLTKGEVETIDAGGYTWKAIMSENAETGALYRQSIIAAAEIEGQIFTVMTWATEDGADQTNRVLYEVMRSIRRYNH